jgi:putative PIN family toxin of toxin-antitoxin system
VSKPPRAVVDTNVLIAAAIKPTGTCRELLDAAVGLQWQPVLSPQLRSELETVMRRSKFRSKLTEKAIQDFIAGLVGISEVVADPSSTATHTLDPDDDYLIALALAAHVDVLVSGDRHLTDLAISGVLVQTPRDFLARVSEA